MILPSMRMPNGIMSSWLVANKSKLPAPQPSTSSLHEMLQHLPAGHHHQQPLPALMSPKRWTHTEQNSKKFGRQQTRRARLLPAKWVVYYLQRHVAWEKKFIEKSESLSKKKKKKKNHNFCKRACSAIHNYKCCTGLSESEFIWIIEHQLAGMTSHSYH